MSTQQSREIRGLKQFIRDRFGRLDGQIAKLDNKLEQLIEFTNPLDLAETSAKMEPC